MIKETARSVEPGLLLSRRRSGCAAGPNVDIFAVFVPKHVRLCDPPLDSEYGYTAAFANSHLLVPGPDSRMDVPAAHRIHQPRLEVIALNAYNAAIVGDADEDRATMPVGEGDNLFRELLGATGLLLELNTRVLAAID